MRAHPLQRAFPPAFQPNPIPPSPPPSPSIASRASFKVTHPGRSTFRPLNLSSSLFVPTNETGLATTPGLEGAGDPIPAPPGVIHEYRCFLPPPSMTFTVVSVERFCASEVI